MEYSGHPLQLKNEATHFSSLILALLFHHHTLVFAKEWLPGTVCSGLYWAVFDFDTSLNLRQVEKSNLNMQEDILMNVF